jgi:glucose-1-phosphate adenylyltransferase
MGIYLFEPAVLRGALDDQSRIDFGRDVIPCLLDQCRVSAFVFDGYWEDVGTIRSFYEANIGLCKPAPLFRFYTPDAPIFTRPRFLPASRISQCRIEQSIVSDGCLLDKAEIVGSVVGLRTRIGTRCTIRNTVVMGADFYEVLEKRRDMEKRGEVCVGIGSDSHIENAIIDKNARIGANVRLVNADGILHGDGDSWMIRDGIIVVPKNAVVPDGTTV